MCDNCLGLVTSAAPSESNFWNGEGAPNQEADEKEGADGADPSGRTRLPAGKRSRTSGGPTATAGFRTAASVKRSGSSGGLSSGESLRQNEDVRAPFKNPSGNSRGSSSHTVFEPGAVLHPPPQASMGFSAANRLQQQNELQSRLPPTTSKRADPYIINLI